MRALRSEQYDNPAGPTPAVLRSHVGKLMEIVAPTLSESDLVEAGATEDEAHELGAAVQSAIQLGEADEEAAGEIATALVEHLAVAEGQTPQGVMDVLSARPATAALAIIFGAGGGEALSDYARHMGHGLPLMWGALLGAVLAVLALFEARRVKP